MTSKMLDALDQQISNEFSASFSYLAMASWCEHRQFMGAGHWLRLQSAEEYSHAMKLFNFVLARNHQASVSRIDNPGGDFTSLLEVFEAAQTQEQAVSRQIDGLFELAFQEKVFAAMAELQWFVTEQVEEEKSIREIVAKMRMVKDDPSSLLDLDRELGARAAAPQAP
ncbi:MAG: ferritin [Acidobacteria bacterium]|jgi:ferritin|nr:ferritin [Acidobacteriota bacterium]